MKLEKLEIGEPIPPNSNIVLQMKVGETTIAVVALEPLDPTLDRIYNIYSNNQLRHIGATAEDVGRAMSHYSYGILYVIDKNRKTHAQRNSQAIEGLLPS